MEGCRVEMSLLRGGLAGGESSREQHHSPRKAKALTVGVLHKNLEVLSMNRDKDCYCRLFPAHSVDAARGSSFGLIDSVFDVKKKKKLAKQLFIGGEDKERASKNSTALRSQHAPSPKLTHLRLPYHSMTRLPGWKLNPCLRELPPPNHQARHHVPRPKGTRQSTSLARAAAPQ
ncbi:hypothetical protein VTI28DRAFT_4072 [Corynascus sepedonium]